MSYLFAVKRMYCHVLEGEAYAFSDERRKKKLLDAVYRMQKQGQWQVCAFCLTDHKAYFITEAENETQLQTGMQQVIACYQRMHRMIHTIHSSGGQVLKGRCVCELHTLHEIAECCRIIHRLPLEHGYVVRLMDYWWSSYITYAGIYNWELVDCSLLSLYFSLHPSSARKKLIQFHQCLCQIERIRGTDVMEIISIS